MDGTAKESAVSAVEATPERIRDLNERIIDTGKQAGESALSAYENLLKSVADAQERATGVGADWVSAFGNAQAQFTRELAAALPAAARDLGERAEALAGAGARQARRVPGVAEAEGGARGVVAAERDVPIGGYDKLSAQEVSKRLSNLSDAELAKVEAYERKHKSRKTVLDRIASARG
jgi:hypothetical protein